MGVWLTTEEDLRELGRITTTPAERKMKRRKRAFVCKNWCTSDRAGDTRRRKAFYRGLQGERQHLTAPESFRCRHSTHITAIRCKSMMLRAFKLRSQDRCLRLHLAAFVLLLSCSTSTLSQRRQQLVTTAIESTW